MKLNIEKETKRFSEHLNLTSNSQIIFSGIFGIGKTYFLKEYFNGSKENYESFFLSPINYSISQNDDIIDYIKYDIAFQLLGKGIDFEKTNYSTQFTSQFYLKNNFLDTMFLLAKNGGKIGKSFSEIFENFKELVNQIKKHNNESQIDEKKDLIHFLTEITNRNKSIFEENRITELINKLIESLKIKSKDKEVVLIIDDIDRLDPEHIFRILNVFACHFDFDNFLNNKFGFEKVILACDIDNIRNLFHTKYGQNVDFSGYIDKFYSREIYYFDNKTIISNSIDNILNSIKIDNQTDGILSIHDEENLTTKLLKEILIDLVLNDLLNLRSLLKLVDKEYNLKVFYFKLGNRKEKNWNYMIFSIFDFLLTLYGSENSLLVALSKLSANVPSKLSDYFELSRYGASYNYY